MVRYVLFFAFAVSFAPAATISTSATCDGVTTVGTVSASCNDGLFEAHASASQTSVFVDAGFSSFMSSGGSATASFSADYVFTVNGGTGNGFFFPCFSGIAGEGREMREGGSAASATAFMHPVVPLNRSLFPNRYRSRSACRKSLLSVWGDLHPLRKAEEKRTPMYPSAGFCSLTPLEINSPMSPSRLWRFRNLPPCPC